MFDDLRVIPPLRVKQALSPMLSSEAMKTQVQGAMGFEVSGKPKGNMEGISDLLAEVVYLFPDFTISFAYLILPHVSGRV